MTNTIWDEVGRLSTVVVLGFTVTARMFLLASSSRRLEDLSKTDETVAGVGGSTRVKVGENGVERGAGGGGEDDAAKIESSKARFGTSSAIVKGLLVMGEVVCSLNHCAIAERS